MPGRGGSGDDGGITPVHQRDQWRAPPWETRRRTPSRVDSDRASAPLRCQPPGSVRVLPPRCHRRRRLADLRSILCRHRSPLSALHRRHCLRTWTARARALAIDQCRCARAASVPEALCVHGRGCPNSSPPQRKRVIVKALCERSAQTTQLVEHGRRR